MKQPLRLSSRLWGIICSRQSLFHQLHLQMRNPTSKGEEHVGSSHEAKQRWPLHNENNLQNSTDRFLKWVTRPPGCVLQRSIETYMQMLKLPRTQYSRGKKWHFSILPRRRRPSYRMLCSCSTASLRTISPFSV